MYSCVVFLFTLIVFSLCKLIVSDVFTTEIKRRCALEECYIKSRQHRTLLYTQSTFAKMVGVSRYTVQKLEEGEVVKSDILFEALVILQLQGSLLDEINELAADVGGYNARQGKSNKTQVINDDF